MSRNTVDSKPRAPLIAPSKQGTYDIEVRANEDCPIKSKVMTLPFVAQDKTVNYIFGIYAPVYKLIHSYRNS